MPLVLAMLALLWLGSALAQDAQPDDPLPPGAKGQVFTLQGQVLPLKATVFDIRGVVAPVEGRVGGVQAALKDLGAKVTEKEIRIDLAADVLFDFDKATLRPEAEPALQMVAAVLKSYPKATIAIDGHTDGKGGDSYNQKLSERRADSVRQWLAANGVTTRMSIRGLGKSQPVAPNVKPDGSDDPVGRQKNRRVEITVKTG
jgi:outer membrane protein OmpA-like peptidoglycan-associated protein